MANLKHTASPQKPVEPYRLLFPVGTLLALAGITLWALQPFFPQIGFPMRQHAWLMVQGFILSFAGGFLLTMLPNVLGLPSAKRVEVRALTFTLLLGGLSALSALEALSQLLSAIAFAIILLFVVSRRKHIRMLPPPFLFVFSAIGFGLISTITLAIDAAWPSLLPMWPGWIARRYISEGMALLLVMGVGAFLLPKFLGAFNPNGKAPKLQLTLNQIVSQLVLIALLIGSYFVEYFFPSDWLLEYSNTRLAYGIRFILFMLQFGGLAGILKAPKGGAAWQYLLWSTIPSISLGLLLSALLPQYLVGWQHLIFIPGFMAMTLLIGSRVLSAHRGAPLLLATNSISLSVIIGGIGIASLFRVLATVHSEWRIWSLTFAAILAISLIIFWGFKVLYLCWFDAPQKK